MNRKHYEQYNIQFWDLDYLFNFGALTVSALKYAGRFIDKNGLEDIEKSIYTLEILQKKLKEHKVTLYRVGLQRTNTLVLAFVNQFIPKNNSYVEELRMLVIQSILREEFEKAINYLNKIKKIYGKIK